MLSQAVAESQAWVATGGLPVADAMGPAESDGESEVDYLPSPRPVQPKVLRSDQV